MCFRPADASGGLAGKCPHCGKTVQSMGGIVLKNCPFCKGDLSELAAQAPGAAGAPKAPGAPGAPKAPGAPGAPKPPSA